MNKDELQAFIARVKGKLRVTKVVATRSVKTKRGDFFAGYAAAWNTVQDDAGGEGADLDLMMTTSEFVPSGMTLQEAKVAHNLVALQADQAVPLVGASGAIAGVLGAYLALFPTRRILGLVGIWPIPLPAALFLGLWFFGQFATSDESIAWQAHATGFAFGFVVAFALRSPLLRRLRRLHAY